MCDIFHSLNPTTELPEHLNDTFDYEPSDICRQAFADLQTLIKRLPLNGEGKMFGVLVVEKDGDVGYLAAYSGQISGRSDWEGFVPAVFDYLSPDGHFKKTEAEIVAFGKRIELLEQDDAYVSAKEALRKADERAAFEIEKHRDKCAEAKLSRDKRRENGISEAENEALIRESQFMKAELRRLRKRWKPVLEDLRSNVEAYEKPLRELKEKRKVMSEELQAWLFEHFEMVRYDGQRRNLMQIFADIPQRIPPSGAGECCAPKLLQYAFLHGMKPISIAEFWVGPSPKAEIRHDGHHYPACRGKCLPILRWMMENDNLGTRYEVRGARNDVLPLVYEDSDIVVVNKPAGMLSIPGKTCLHSVFTVLKEHYGGAFIPLMVHRLDQDTSGLLVVAKNKRAHESLQQQFSEHSIEKKYVALLENNREYKGKAMGIISLPLLPDLLNRPYQIVDHENGKEAVTRYCFSRKEEGGERSVSRREERGRRRENSLLALPSDRQYRRVLLEPLTGRTHQLRVHCAHAEGLNCPILGDRLYGSQRADRLYLHAETLVFTHPTTGERMEFNAKAPF